MFKFILDSLDGVDQNHHAFYEQTDDKKWRLKVEGAVPREKLEEFRTNNVQMKEQLKKFEGIDPEQYKKDVERLKTAKTDEDLEKQISDRTAQMRQEHAAAIAKMTGDLESSQKMLEVMVIDGEVRRYAAELGAYPTAVDDLILRARGTFKVEKGVAMPYKDGQVQYGKDAINPMTMKEWLTDTSKNAPHLFNPNQGGGAKGSGFNRGSNANLSATDKIRQGLENG